MRLIWFLCSKHELWRALYCIMNLFKNRLLHSCLQFSMLLLLYMSHITCSTMLFFLIFSFCCCLRCSLNWLCNDLRGVMRAQESSSKHVNTSPSSSQESDHGWARPRPPGPGRKWEGREVGGSQRRAERGETGRGMPHRATSKTEALHSCSQSKHISGGAHCKTFRLLIWDAAVLLFLYRSISASLGFFFPRWF